jgi:hypothetical protein
MGPMANGQKAVFQIRPRKVENKKARAAGYEREDCQQRNHSIQGAQMGRPIHPSDMGLSTNKKEQELFRLGGQRQRPRI